MSVRAPEDRHLASRMLSSAKACTGAEQAAGPVCLQPCMGVCCQPAAALLDIQQHAQGNLADIVSLLPSPASRPRPAPCWRAAAGDWRGASSGRAGRWPPHLPAARRVRGCWERRSSAFDTAAVAAAAAGPACWCRLHGCWAPAHLHPRYLEGTSSGDSWCEVGWRAGNDTEVEVLRICCCCCCCASWWMPSSGSSLGLWVNVSECVVGNRKCGGEAKL